MRKDTAFTLALLLLITVAGALMIGCMSTGNKQELHGQTLYDLRAISLTSPDCNLSAETLFQPLNVTKIAHFFHSEMREYPMSVEEAADRVRSFVGDVSANVTYGGNASTFFGMEYDMRSGDGVYSVNPMTGQVFSAWASPGGISPPVGNVSMDRAKSIATDFARAHYKGFDSMNMTLTCSEMSGEYLFDWYEYVDGVQTLNHVNIEFAPASGRVLFYYGIEFPVPALLKHPISNEQAIEIAMARLGDYREEDIQAYLASGRPFNITFTMEPSQTGDLNATIMNIMACQKFKLFNFTQRQVREVIVDEVRVFPLADPTTGSPVSTNGHRWWIDIDAGTGEVISIDRCF